MSNTFLSGLYEVPFLTSILYVSVSIFLFLSLVLAYALLRARDQCADVPDPQLGLKVFLHFFTSLGILLLLSGLSVILADLLNGDGEILTRPQRTGLALALAGLAFALLHGALLWTGTNDREFATVRRFFLGWRLVLHGFVILFATTAILQLLLQRDPPGLRAREAVRAEQLTFFALLLIWGPMWLVHAGLLYRASRSTSKPVVPSVTWDAKE